MFIYKAKSLTVKYRLPLPAFVLNLGLVHSLQDIKQCKWTMKPRLLWPTLYEGQTSGQTDLLSQGIMLLHEKFSRYKPSGHMT